MSDKTLQVVQGLVLGPDGKPSVASGTAGDVMRRLIQCNMDVSCLRTNDILGDKDWEIIDTVVLEHARRRQVAVAELMRRNLVFRFSDGLSATVLEYVDMGVIGDATVSMSPRVRGDKSQINYVPRYMPLPLTFMDWDIDVRTLGASRRAGRPLDTTWAGRAADRVGEATENMLFNGSSTFTVESGVIYGLCDHPSRQPYHLTAAWDASGANPVRDVRLMKQLAVNAGFYGPYGVWTSGGYDVVLDDDYVRASTNNTAKTVRQRLLELRGIEFVQPCDFMPANTVVLVQLTPDVIRMVEGMPLQNLQWKTEGDLVLNMKVMQILVPQIRADQDGNCGVIHGHLA
jgi:uncharacterized linocin/CFP29 family protein